MVRQDPGSRGSHNIIGFIGLSDALGEEGGVPRGVEEGEVEGLVELVGTDVTGDAGIRLNPRLGDHCAITWVGVQELAPFRVDLVDAVLVPVGRGLRRHTVTGHLAGGHLCIRKSIRLDQTMRNIHAESIDPTVQPELQDVEERFTNRRLVPVQIRLAGIKEVQVPLVLVGSLRPRGVAEDRLPIVRRSIRVLRVNVPEDVPVALIGTRLGGQSPLEPRMLIACVIRDQVEDHLQAQFVGSLD